MSYILDALRRADAERERGEVPGLHTQQFGVLPEDDEAPRRPRLLIAAIVVLVLALAAALAWNFLGGGEVAQKAVVAQAPVVLPVTPVTPAPAPAPAASQAPIVVAAPAPLATGAAKKADLARPPSKPRVRKEAPAESPAPSASERIFTRAELPEAIRRELPNIAFGGASYSGDKASRMVILNGRVFHEGDTVAPGLVLKQVKQKGAVLAYKGYRYEIGF
ncbi:MAG: general secretion pathway protein GspB [Caldimonas sp.]